MFEIGEPIPHVRPAHLKGVGNPALRTRLTNPPQKA
jgi:hypothetical protein